MTLKRINVFISYSWDGPDHQEWVLKLATDLMETFGINVILDQFELSAGKDLTHFMESSIESAHKVLVILTPNYKQKAENRKSGVGYETSMITQELFESPISKIKFIPILREGSLNESSPKFLKSKLCHSMEDDGLYVNKLYELSKIIYDRPVIEKPALGKIPDFSSDDVDPIIKMANKLTSEEKMNNEIDRILDSSDGVQIFNSETEKINSQLVEKTELYKKSTSIPFIYESNNRDTAVIKALGYSVSVFWSLKYLNTSREAELKIKYWNGHFSTSNSFRFPGEEPKTIKTNTYTLDMDYSKNILWSAKSGKLTTNELISNAFLFVIKSIQDEKSKKFRK